MSTNMLHLSRWAAPIVGAPLTLFVLLACALFVLLACVTPAGAGIQQLNGVSANGVGNNARITTGSALGDLNGVAVEAVFIPEGTIR